MPRSASSKQPCRRSDAPVNAPFSWPKISLSSSVSGIAAQLIATNGDAARGLSWWIVCATSSLPVPDSPLIEHRRRRRRRLLDDAVDLPHARAAADHPPEGAVVAQLPPQRLDLAHRLLPLDDLREQDLKPLRIDRLGEVVVGAVLDGVDGRFDRTLGGQHDDADVRVVLAERLEQAVPVQARHDEVGHDDRRAERRDLLEGLLAIPGAVGQEAPRADEFGQPDAGRRVVLDDQHALGRRRAVGSGPLAGVGGVVHVNASQRPGFGGGDPDAAVSGHSATVLVIQSNRGPDSPRRGARRSWRARAFPTQLAIAGVLSLAGIGPYDARGHLDGALCLRRLAARRRGPRRAGRLVPAVPRGAVLGRDVRPAAGPGRSWLHGLLHIPVVFLIAVGSMMAIRHVAPWLHNVATNPSKA